MKYFPTLFSLKSKKLSLNKSIFNGFLRLQNNFLKIFVNSLRYNIFGSAWKILKFSNLMDNKISDVFQNARCIYRHGTSSKLYQIHPLLTPNCSRSIKKIAFLNYEHSELF